MTAGALPSHSVAEAWKRFDETDAGKDGLNAFLATDRAGSIAEAANASSEDPSRVLAGVPVAIKDNLATLLLPTTCGSRILDGYISPYEATAVRKLREAGAIVIGKTNMDEFAMGSSTENSAYGPTRNPLDPTRVPGGSSGGSAVAVAAGIVPLSLGSETGGSVRQPAAFCGIVGVKPTYGRVSRFGLVAYASSLDHVGVFARTVHDSALALEIIAGHDSYDATSASQPVPSFAEAAAAPTNAQPLAGLVVGRPREYFTDALDPRIGAHCEAALERLRSLGAEVRDVSLPHTALAIPVYYVLAPAEASSNLSRYDGVRYGPRAPADGLREMYERTRSGGFGAEVTRRILLGTYVLSAGYYDAYYRRAQTVRALITQDFDRVFASGVHVLFTPTAPTPAFRIGEVSNPYDMYLSDIYTVTANLAGIPAMSQPIGLVDGMPVGGQFMAARFDEVTMFRAAVALEQSLQPEVAR